MSVQKLDFGEPFFSAVYVEDEAAYTSGERPSLVINLAARSGRPFFVQGQPTPPLKAAVVAGVTLTQLDRALVFPDYERCRIDDPTVAGQIKQTWRSLYQCSGQERHRTLPYYKSPKIRVGGDTELNLCYVDAPCWPSGPHREHDRDFDEVHAQILGMGKMQKVAADWQESGQIRVYQEFIMAPGDVHDTIYDRQGSYPWHQYCSVTPCVYLPIEIDR